MRGHYQVQEKLGPGGKWELTRGMVMPQGCNVTMSYQIIHEKVPSRDYNFYGGPAGGLSTGVANLKEDDYRQTGRPMDMEAGIIDVGGTERYIPTGALSVQDEQKSYLTEVDGKNAGISNITYNGGPEDSETGLPPWFTSTQEGIAQRG